MMKKRMALLIILALSVEISSEAALLAYDGFDYSTGSLSGENGGTGWTDAWSSGDHYSVVANSLEMPNLPFATTGGSIIGQNSIDRNFSGIDFSQEGTYYTSFIIKRTGWESTDGGGEWFDVHFRKALGNKEAATAGISSTERFEARIATDDMNRAGSAATTDPYFIVTKIVTHASGNDEIYLKAYSESNTVDLSETTSWTVTETTTNIDLIANRIALLAGTDGDDGSGVYQAAVDEIRIGTTWADVVPEQADVVPKPYDPNLIAYEGFDYPTGSLKGQCDGHGWTGSWDKNADYNVVAGSLTMPNLPFVPTGGSIIGHNSASRNFTGIDLSKDAVYYSSFIMQRTGWSAADGGGEWFDFHFRGAGNAEAATAGVSSAERFEARIAQADMVRADGAATTNSYFIVSKIVAHASGNDEIYLKAYSASDVIDSSEVSNWTVAGGVTNCDLFADMVSLVAGHDDDADGLYQAAVDEIRIGRTWAAVVPEPSGYQLMFERLP